MHGNPTAPMTHRPFPLLITRPAAQAERFAGQVRAALGPDVPIVISPILRIEPRPVTLDLTGMAGLILTSENAVRSLSGHSGVSGRIAYCVGDRTAAAARALGLQAHSAGGAAPDLVDMIRQAAPMERLLFPRGAHSRGHVADELAAAGIKVEEVVTYDQIANPLNAEAKRLAAGAIPIVAPLFSPRSAKALGEALGDAQAPLHLVSLSPAVDAAWSGPAPASRHIAKQPEIRAVLPLLAAIYADCLP